MNLRQVVVLGVAALIVAPAAFALGMMLTSADAQETPPAEPTPIVIYEYDDDVPPETITVVEVPGEVGGASGSSSSCTPSTLGSATQPTSGEWLYLSTICRYISLPDDVDHTGTAWGLCAPQLPGDTDYDCPDWPLHFLQRPNSGEVTIDMSGTVGASTADAALFPFLFPTTGE